MNSPRLRYKPYHYQYKYIYGHKGDVDIAFMGTSRTMRCIIAQYFEKSLSKHSGKSHVIYDISRSGRGEGLEYVMIKDFLKLHKVKILAIHYNDTLDEIVHPNFIKVASFSDIFSDYNAYPDSSIIKANCVLRLLGLKLGENLHMIINGEYLKTAKSIPVRTSDYSVPVTVKPKTLKLAADTHQNTWRKKSEREWGIHSFREYRNTYYIHQILALAKEKGTKVIFFYIPRLYEPPISKKMGQEFENEFSSQWLQPPLDVKLKMYEPGGYTDTGHVNVKGAEIYMDWLSDLIFKKFENELSTGVN